MFVSDSLRIAQIRVHIAKEFVEDLKWVKARAGGVGGRWQHKTDEQCVCVVCHTTHTQEENSDMLREALACSLKLSTAADAEDIDDDGRPLKREG